MKKLLKLYKDEVRRQFKETECFTVCVRLTPEFLKACEDRIIEGHKKYGDDWMFKDCIAERDAEVYDYFNYTILDRCQQRANGNRK